MIQRRLLNITELSEMIGLKPNTIYHWVSQRRIPFVRLGGRTKFDIEEIDNWIKESSIACKDFS